MDEPFVATAMNPFVDSSKRSIDLPFGCKNLADTLANANREPESRDRWKLLNGLQETERYLAGLLLRPEAILYFDISIPHSPHRLQLVPLHRALCILLFIDGSDKNRLPRVRKFFHDAEIFPAVDAMGSILGSTGVHEAPSTRVLIYPLPVVAPDAAELITHVLREAFALSEEAQLYVSLNEKTVA
jgi:hypothetical protein